MGGGGDGNNSAAAGIPEFLVSNVQFAPFLDDKFDAGEFASNVLADAHITAQAQNDQLQDGLYLLQENLVTEVGTRRKEMLEQANRLAEAESAFAGTSLAVGSLQAALRRVRAEIVEPYQQVEVATRQVAAIHGTAEVLRAALQRLKLAAKLRTSLQERNFSESPLDLAKAARLVADAEAAEREADLSGLDVIKRDIQLLSSARTQISSHAEDLLRKGMDEQSQAQVASALQVFFNLGSLREAVDAELERHASVAATALSSALDGRKLQAAASGAMSSASGRTSVEPTLRRQEILWEKVAEALHSVSSAATAAWHLQRVLAKKRDPLTHVVFSDALMDPALATATTGPQVDAMWSMLTAALKETIDSAAEGGVKSGFVRSALVVGYPRLAAALEDCVAKLLRDTQITGSTAAVTDIQAETLLAAASPFQTAYLAATVARLNDTVLTAFPGGSRSLPTSVELQKCIGRMHEELKAVANCSRLAAQTAAAVGAALQLMVERAEMMTAGGPEARAVTGPATPSAIRNTSIAALLDEVARSVGALLVRQPPAATAVIKPALTAVHAASVAAVLPLLSAMADAVETELLHMHDSEIDWAVSSPPESEHNVMRPSAYMTNTVALLAHFRSEFFGALGSSGGGSALVERLACRVVTLFLRHSCLLRPLGSWGKLQLARDASELEEAVVAHLAQPQAIGRPFRSLRAFKPLLFADDDKLTAAAETAAQSLPKVCIASHLLSRGPQLLHSPMSRSGLTPTQYSAWLDQHSALEAQKSFREALQSSSPDVVDSDIAKLIAHICT